jgi:hypothetical protein
MLGLASQRQTLEPWFKTFKVQPPKGSAGLASAYLLAPHSTLASSTRHGLRLDAMHLRVPECPRVCFDGA